MAENLNPNPLLRMGAPHVGAVHMGTLHMRTLHMGAPHVGAPHVGALHIPNSWTSCQFWQLQSQLEICLLKGTPQESDHGCLRTSISELA